MALAAFLTLSKSIYRNVSCKVENGKLVFKDGVDKSWDAYAVYDGDINTTGWYQLHVIGDTESDDHNMMRCAGAVEGYVSQHDIFNNFNLICDMESFPRLSEGGGDDRYPDGWAEFMNANYRYMGQSVAAYSESEYWRTTGLVLEQFNGLVEGYNIAAPENEKMSTLDFWILQLLYLMNSLNCSNVLIYGASRAIRRNLAFFSYS